jgi:hypothetical protein
VGPRKPIRTTFAVCAWATAPQIENAKPMAKIPTHFRFPILRHCSGHVLNFRLSEKESSHRTQDLIFILFAPNRKIQNHLITRSALASTFGGIVRRNRFAAFRLITNSNFVGWSTGRSAACAILVIVYVVCSAPEAVRIVG